MGVKPNTPYPPPSPQPDLANLDHVSTIDHMGQTPPPHSRDLPKPPAVPIDPTKVNGKSDTPLDVKIEKPEPVNSHPLTEADMLNIRLLLSRRETLDASTRALNMEQELVIERMLKARGILDSAAWEVNFEKAAILRKAPKAK